MSRPDWAREGRDWPNRAASRFVDAASLRWHVQVMGEGPVVLLLHGTGAATHSWRGLMPLLAGHFTLVAPDLPGHGFTGTPRDGGMGLPATARRIAALVAALGVEPAMIVGHSAGAAIGLRMALDGLTKSRLLGSLNGALLPFPGLAARLFPALARMLFLNPLVPSLFAMRARSPGEVAHFLPRATGSRIEADGVALYGRLFGTSGHCAGALAMMAHWDLEALAADLPKLPLPLALLHGERDSAVPASVSRRVAAATGAELVLLPGLGHLAHEEDPALVASILMRIASEYAIGSR